MTELPEPMDLTMESTKRTRDNIVVETNQGTPNPKDKKAPRSILKGPKTASNDEETRMIEDEEASDDDVIGPPQLNRARNKEAVRSNLDTKFDTAKQTTIDEVDKNVNAKTTDIINKTQKNTPNNNNTHNHNNNNDNKNNKNRRQGTDTR
jgi:hypothetical protein